MTRRIFISLALSTSCALLLGACGKSVNESERAYADTCVKLLKGNEAAYRKRCECEAGVVAPKLTPGELKAYVASPDWPKGALNPEAVTKFTTERGFTMEENASLGQKMQASFAEISKACSK